MSTTQSLCNEMWQPEPQRNMVESMPVEERRKLSDSEKTSNLFYDCTWKDLRGLSFILDMEV